MRKFLKALSFVMSAVISLTAVPMISADKSYVSAEYDADYCMDPDNYAWTFEKLTAYNDGSILNFWNKQYNLCFKTKDGAEPTAESLGLPEGMAVEKCIADNLGTISDEDADYCISADSEEEICQLAGMSESWIESGIVTETFVHRIFGYGCVWNLTINITLKEPDESFDPNSFEGLEEFKFNKSSDTVYSMDYHNQSIDTLAAPGIVENVTADERVESVDYSFVSCCVAHYLHNDIPADEYYEKFSAYYGVSDEAAEESAKTSNNSAYYTNPDNIEWESEKTAHGCLTVYKDGAAKYITQKYYTLGIKTVDGTAPTADELGLPEGMEITDNYSCYIVGDEYCDCFITVKSEDEIAKLCKMSDEWIADGIIEETCVRILYCYGCLSNYTVSVKLKNADKDFDPNSVSGLEDVTFELTSSSDNLYFSYRLPGIKFLEFREIPDILNADERVENVDYSFSICDVLHAVYNEVSTDEYLDCYYTADEPSISDDPNENITEPATESVTTAPKQTAVTTTTTTTIPVTSVVVSEFTTSYLYAGFNVNDIRPAAAGDIVIEPGKTAEMTLSISDKIDYYEKCSGSMLLSDGITCEKITYGNNRTAGFTVSDSTVTFEMPESTVTITLSADEDISDGEYQIEFGNILKTYCYPFNGSSDGVYVVGGYQYNVSGGAVNVVSPAVTTSIPETIVTTSTETTQTTVTSVYLTSISIDDLYPPYTRSTDIVRNAHADDVVLRNGESAEMKLSVPDREESDGSCSVTVNLPYGVYCNSVINSKNGEYIPFHMETSSEETVVSFSNSSDEVVMTLSIGGEIAPGTYQAIFKAKGLYIIDVTSGESYAYLYGNYEYEFSGGAIEIADSETSAETQLKGDISGNGEIDIYDAIEIAKEIMGIRTFTEEEKKIADINGDGMVNLYDAIEIAEKLL